MRRVLATSITAVAAVSLMLGQGAVPFPNPRLGNPGPPQVPPTPAQQTPAQPPPAQPTPQPPAPNPPTTPNAAAPAPQANQAPQPNQAPPANPPAAPAAPPLADNGAFMVPGASLTEMIDILAKRLRINYILDPRVKGTVTIYTYGEVRSVDLMQLLQTILRVNGATMVQVGDLYRIVPITLVAQLPVAPQVNADPKTLPDDERMILNLIFLKYTTASEIDKLITPFLGEGAAHSVYDAANLLILQDNSRSMRRTMELISLFDSDIFAGQRVRLFDVSNSRPSDLVKELDSVFKAYALSEKSSSVRFLPVDRINTLIAVAPNPGIFVQVDEWIKKLDIPVKLSAGGLNNYAYRLRYGRAETVAAAIMALYTGNVQALIAMAAQANSGMVAAGMGYGNMMPGGFGAGGGGYGAYPGSPGGGAYGANYGGYGANYGYAQTGAGSPYGGGIIAPPSAPAGAVGAPAAPGTPGAAPGTTDLSGTFLGSGPAGVNFYRGPKVIPNPFDNTILIQGTPEEYEQVTSLIRQLDIAPRQVLIDAKIYEVDLTGAWTAGVSSYLQSRNAPPPSGASTVLTVSGTAASGLTLTTGALVLKSHELLALLNAQENTSRTRVIAAPSIIATDSVPATMNVGDQVPVLTSQAVLTGTNVGGTTPFANNISTEASGTTLSILARVNSSGVITMVVNQQVSAPEAPPPGVVTTASTSFSNRSISTQMTVNDGDTVAIGGIITEKRTEASGGVPILHRIPVLGAAFGAKNNSTSRVELIIFLTPRVIYDTNQMVDATDELKSNLKRVTKMIKE
jgi:general secretion pathway protein D